jgi:enoyl-CoA hydratase/carnithine racemase
MTDLGTETGTESGTAPEQVLTIEKEASIAWLKLNRPKVMNCLNRDLLKALLAACDLVG